MEIIMLRIIIWTFFFLFSNKKFGAIAQQLSKADSSIAFSNHSDPLLREEQILSLFREYSSKTPPIEGGNPVLDKLQLYIVSIDSIDDSNMQYSMRFYFRQRWMDTRLKHNFSDAGFVEIDMKLINDIWVPDVFIPNEKQAHFHDVTVPNKLIQVHTSGEILYSVRISGQFTCDMNLYKYPLDRQICEIRFESYAYSASTVVLRWQSEPMKLSPELTISHFSLVGQKASVCDGFYYGVNYTCVSLKFMLERKRGYYIIQVYIPSILICILSWVNFWLDVDAVPARISVGLLTVLTMATQIATALDSPQSVSYIKALDVWLAACLFFVFAALIEFAYVNVTSRVQHRRTQSDILDLLTSSTEFIDRSSKDKKDEIWHKFISSIVENIHKDEYQQRYTSSDKEKARRVDKISRILFPAMFLLFNVVYWTTYLVWEPVQDL